MYANAAILIAVALNVLALVYKFFPPQKINKYYGYHMKSSMRNDDTWNEANSYASRLLTLLSIVFLVAALLASNKPDFNAWALAAFAVVLIGSCAFIYFLTERHMKNVFDEEGKRKR